MGVHLQASLLTSALASAVVSLLWIYSEPLLVFLRQDPETSRLAADFLRHSVPALFAYGFIQCALRFLQAQSVVAPLVAFSLLPLAAHVGVAHALVNVLGMGFAGAAVATSASLWLSFLMLAAYVMLSARFRETWPGFTTEAFRHVLPGMKLAIPSAVMVWLVPYSCPQIRVFYDDDDDDIYKKIWHGMAWLAASSTGRSRSLCYLQG
jgi:multidrug resistance protein, MATE family